MSAVSVVCSLTFKLTDFGAAKEIGKSEEFTSMYGTEEYLVSFFFWMLLSISFILRCV